MPRLAESAQIVRGPHGGLLIDGEEFPWYTAGDPDTVHIDTHPQHSTVWIPVVVAGPVTVLPNVHPSFLFGDQDDDTEAETDGKPEPLRDEPDFVHIQRAEPPDGGTLEVVEVSDPDV